jgi:hypothetical protein
MAPPEATAIDSDAVLDGALTQAVERAGSTGAPLEELWRAAFGVEPELASSADRRRRLAASIDRLIAAGVARRLPSRSDAYDRTAVPRLPLVLRRVPEVREARVQTLLPADLRPELAGARVLESIRPDEVVTLEVVNSFLRDWVPGRPDVPARERSLEIFGDEKRLDALCTSRLFATGVLSLELLHSYIVHPPFVHQRVSDASMTLVIENHHTYDSARRALAHHDHGIGVIAYGAGGAIRASITYLADLGPSARQAFYFGDLDAAGLTIASAASETSLRAGGPPLKPAAGLYRALLSSDRRRSTVDVNAERADELVAWLPDELRDAAAGVLITGSWIPQEAVGYETLECLEHWLT